MIFSAGMLGEWICRAGTILLSSFFLLLLIGNLDRIYFNIGKMPERSNGLPWKGSMSERASRVRIPFFPPTKNENHITKHLGRKADGANERIS